MLNIGTSHSFPVLEPSSIHFWSFLFALAHWVDSSLWAGATNNVDANLTSLTDLSNGPVYLVFNFVTGALYVVLPTFLTMLIGIAGQKVGEGMASGVGRSIGEVGGKGGSGVGAAISAVTKGKG